METSLIGMKVEIRISDPWELGDARSWEPLPGTIIKVQGAQSSRDEGILIRLQEPLQYKEVDCEYFAANPRLVGGTFEQLLAGKDVFSDVTRIPPERAHSDDPFDLSWWRGGVAIIGNVAPIPITESAD